MGTIDFWIAALGVPIVVLCGNGFLRAAVFGMPQTSAADLILTLIVFDGAVILQTEEFSRFVTDHTLKEALRGIYLVILIINMVLWYYSVAVLEKALNVKFNKRLRKYAPVPAREIFLAFCLSVFVVGLNTASFVWR